MEDILASHHAKVEEIVQSRAAARSVGVGDIVVGATFLTYLTKVQTNGQWANVETPELPAPRSVQKRDGTGSYTAKLEVRCRVDSFNHVNGACERVDDDDGVMRWRVMTKVNYFDKGSAFLRANRAEAWRRDDNGLFVHEDQKHQRIRDLISEEGELVTKRFITVGQNHRIKVKVADNTKCVFRAKQVHPPHLPLVQQFAPLTFTRVELEQWVNEIENEETDGEEKRTVKDLLVSTAYVCKGETRISEDYDCSLPASEQFHTNEDPNVHHLVPVEDLRARRARVASMCYYLVRRHTTPHRRDNVRPDAQGISIVRDRMVPDHVLKQTEQGPQARCTIMFTVYQWKGRPPYTAEEAAQTDYYSVKAACKATDTKTWLNFGITDVQSYASILMAHSSTQRQTLCLPIHLQCELWERITLEHDSNHPEKLHNREELKNMRGFYVFGISNLVPDYLRYFRQNGLQVSQEWIGREFDDYIIEGKGKRTFLLESTNEDVPPVSTNYMQNVIVPLGNAKHHAIKGNAVAVLDGQRDFFVLCSHEPTDEEIGRWYLPGRQEPVADAYMDELKGRNDPDFHYWIFAVRKDAKLSQRRLYDQSALPPLTDPEPQTPKRPREEEPEAPVPPMAKARVEEEEEEEEYE